MCRQRGWDGDGRHWVSLGEIGEGRGRKGGGWGGEKLCVAKGGGGEGGGRKWVSSREMDKGWGGGVDGVWGKNVVSS